MKLRIVKYNPAQDFIALYNEDAKKIFKDDKNAKIMTVAEFALNLELVRHFNLEYSLTESCVKQIPIFSPINLIGDLRIASKEQAIESICRWLNRFANLDLKPETQIVIYCDPPLTL